MKPVIKNNKHRIRKTPYKNVKRKMHKTLARLNQDDIKELYGAKFIAGIDDVGTGAVCGAITLGLCILRVDDRLPVKDSKKYSSVKAREAAEAIVDKHAVFHMTADAPVRYINEYGHARAVKEAFVTLLKAVAARFNKRDIVIILDGNSIPKELPAQFKGFRIIAVPKADVNICAVSAASVVAKCSRDRHMVEMSQTGYYSPYALEENMGYLTPAHREAIVNHGLTSQHRTNVEYKFLKNS